MAQNSYNAFLFEFLKFTFILPKSEDLSKGSFKTINFNKLIKKIKGRITKR